MRLHCLLHTPVALEVALPLEGFTVLLGRSGAGKTCLLKAIAGLLPARTEPWNGWPPQRRPVGYLPQGYGLFPHLRAWQNVAFALNGARAERRRRAAALLERVGLREFAERYPRELSGGQQQRVALARALAHEPELLLLDEPTSAQDVVTRDALLAELVDLVRAAGVPALAATHDFHVAALADRLAVLVDGRIVQQGSPGAVFARPADRMAARLVGVSNVYRGRVVETDATRSLVEIAALRLAAESCAGIAPGAEVDVAIRAEAVTLCTDGKGWPARVAAVRAEGLQHRVVLDSAGLRVEALLAASLGAPRLGAVLRFDVAPGHVHLMPARPES
ncbi:MAG: ABC transporter ATP-binding protein [Nevskia sp.]|nr:ABC transporter ATP-binding protein [Nevskia sp.]